MPRKLIQYACNYCKSRYKFELDAITCEKKCSDPKSISYLTRKTTGFTFEELEFYAEAKGLLTCDMVDWAIKNLKKDKRLRPFLKRVFENASPMWQQSHYKIEKI